MNYGGWLWARLHERVLKFGEGQKRHCILKGRQKGDMGGHGYREWSITTGLKHFQGERRRGSRYSGAISS